MSRMNRRHFTWMATSGVASAALVACGGEAVEEDLTPTRVSNVEGAPPTLAPNATPFSSEQGEGGGEEQATGGGGQGGMAPIELEAQDPYNWSMYEFEVAPGQDIHIVNTGSLPHNFHADEAEGWDIATPDLAGGEEATVTAPQDAEVGSEVVFYCSVPGHREAGMEGTMTIVEAGAAAGGGGGASPEAEASPASEGATPAEEQAAGGGGGTEPITVTGLDELAYDPSEFEASPGQTIAFVNGGALQHDFNIDELGLNTALLNGGEQEEITVPDDAQPGDYVYYCSVPGHRAGGMEGTMTVV